MKKPEEIKKGLEFCANSSFCDEECPYFEECNEGLESHATDALAYIQQLEAQVPRWIPVEEMLPPLGEVLICTRGNYVGVAWFHANGKFETGGGLMLDTKFVSHWMPLPEPPKEDAK